MQIYSLEKNCYSLINTVDFNLTYLFICPHHFVYSGSVFLHRQYLFAVAVHHSFSSITELIRPISSGLSPMSAGAISAIPARTPLARRVTFVANDDGTLGFRGGVVHGGLIEKAI